MKYAIITFGCRVNQADSLGLEEALLAGGATASAPETADLVIVNTCSVTASVARSNPGARIVVTGCYATRRPDELAHLPNVVRVVPNDEKPRLIPLTRAGDIGDGPCGAAIEPGVAGRTAFTLGVQTGCAEPCSYCIIPATRGMPRSVPVADVRREVERVAAAGFKEIALTGVHLGSYGRDLDPPSSLIDLLRAIDAVRPNDDVLFRISSLEPMDCITEIVDLVATSPRFAAHFHLPLQHASNRILSTMRRPYTIEQYAGLVDGIRTKIPGASIGSDIIVGFPSENDADFEELAAYLESSPLTHVHVFPYSDRPGTPASAMADKVPGLIVRERARRIREIGQRLALRFREAQLGTVQRALTLEDGSLAVTGNYLKVRIAPGQARNEWVRLRLTSQHDGELLRG
jgi:threonylcarbamoyladenosine tRNA methylthiotransferase MtaB